MKYDYRKNLIEDIKRVLEDEQESYKDLEREELEEKLNEDLFIDDSVTGNGSGSYTFNRYEAEENISHNMDLLKETCEEFGSNPFELLENPEAADVSIRCYLLGECIAEVLEEYFSEKTKKAIKVTKKVDYIKNGVVIDSQIIEKNSYYSIKEVENKIKNENLANYYNKKSISLYETIEAVITTETGIKKLYKTITPEGKETTNL